MVYADAKAICEVLGDSVSDPAACERRMANYERMTESTLDCTPSQVDEAVKRSEVVALVYSQDDCPHCQDQLGTMMQAMERIPGFTAVEVNTSQEACGKLADALNIQRVPTTVLYVRGEKRTELTGDQSLEDLEREVQKARETQPAA